ncbi:MAG: leucine-rich repeat protein [Lachnospiraceae bacterium]
MGKNVTSIGKNSFYGCQKLAKVTFKGTSVKTIKSKAFKKTASKVTVSVPKSIRNNKKKAAAFQKKLTKSGMSKKLKLK